MVLALELKVIKQITYLLQLNIPSIDVNSEIP